MHIYKYYIAFYSKVKIVPTSLEWSSHWFECNEHVHVRFQCNSNRKFAIFMNLICLLIPLEEN